MDFENDWKERKLKPGLDEDIEILMDGYMLVFDKPQVFSISKLDEPNSWAVSLDSELIDLRYF